MNFSIFCSVFSLQSSRGLDVVEIAEFRRNSSNLGTTWGIKEESSELNNNSWKYYFQILASAVKLIDYFNYVRVLLHVSFFLAESILTSCCLRFGRGVSSIRLFSVLQALAPGRLFSFIISSKKQPRISSAFWVPPKAL